MNTNVVNLSDLPTLEFLLMNPEARVTNKEEANSALAVDLMRLCPHHGISDPAKWACAPEWEHQLIIPNAETEKCGYGGWFTLSGWGGEVLWTVQLNGDQGGRSGFAATCSHVDDCWIRAWSCTWDKQGNHVRPSALPIHYGYPTLAGMDEAELLRNYGTDTPEA